MKISNILKKIILPLTKLNLFFWSMIWLMIITTIGTIEQKNIGLFASQEKYFSSLYFTFFDIPLPGGGLVLLLMTVGLIGQLFYKTNYRTKKKSGILLTHLGAVILLSGSLLTFFLGEEGSMVIKEGETLDHVSDYRKYELKIVNEDGKSVLFKMPLIKADASATLTNPIKISNDLTLIQLKTYANCLLVPNQNPMASETGFAKMFTFSSPESSQTKENPELCTELNFLEREKLVTYRIFLHMVRTQKMEYLGQIHDIKIENQAIALPFKVKLLDFEKKFHQGTLISKSFKSYVEIHDGDLSFKRVIEMNSPLRYKGYTFYQSSFSENSEGEMSELAVVKNIARWFPYLSSLVLCVGVLLHLIIKTKEKGIVS